MVTFMHVGVVLPMPADDMTIIMDMPHLKSDSQAVVLHAFILPFPLLIMSFPL